MKEQKDAKQAAEEVKNFFLNEDLIARRRRLLIYVLAIFLSLNIIWSLYSGQEQNTLLYRIIFAGTGFVGVGTIIYLALTKNVQRAVWGVIVGYVIFCALYAFGIDATEYFMPGLIFIVIISFLVLEWKGLIPVAAIYTALAVILFAAAPEQQRVGFDRSFRIFSPTYDTLPFLWAVFYALFSLKRRDDVEISKKNSELLGANASLAEDTSRIKTAQKRLTQKREELNRLQSSLKGREQLMKELEEELATYE